MSNKGMIINECERMNAVRCVLEGRVDSATFFRTIQGDLLVTGADAGNQAMVLDLFCSGLEKNDMPTILLTSHPDIMTAVQQKISRHEIDRVMTSCPEDKNYHPFYGMSAQQILRFVRMTAEEMGYGILTDQVMIYAAAVLNVVAAKYSVSLPAIVKLLNEDDDFISEFALQSGLSNVIADNIRANHEAGIVLRRLFERLEEIFEDIYTPGSDTRYNFQSGAKGNLAGMAMYACSSNQSIFNAYLKEEIFYTLKRVPRLRIILDEMMFVDENDELMQYLMQARRQGKVELMMVAQNVRETMHGNAELDFPNVVLFHHGTPAATDDLSRDLFGTYQYHYPVPIAGNTPHILVSFKHAVHWQPQAEERLRVRSQDMYAKPGIFGRTSDYLAVKTTANANVYLIRTSDFLPVAAEFPAVV
jgi:hypothetical protein